MVGVLGESVNVIWTLTKANGADTVVGISLFLGNSTENKVLYDGSSGLNKQNLAREMFDERIQTSFKEPSYTLTLNNLSFTDTVTFTLVVIQRIGSTNNLRPLSIKSVAVIVKGMYIFLNILELTNRFDPQQDKID